MALGLRIGGDEHHLPTLRGDREHMGEPDLGWWDQQKHSALNIVPGNKYVITKLIPEVSLRK
jgi:hypothetical protein